MSRQRWRIAGPLIAAVVLAIGGCAGKSRTYSTQVERLDERLTVRATLTDKRLRCEMEAGDYRVGSAALITRDGRRIEPTTISRAPDRVVGGASIGLGTGIGSGGVGVGVGTSRHVGGRLQPGPVEALWDEPPAADQPWFVEVALEVEPPLTQVIALAKIVGAEAAAHDGAVPREQQRWKLLDGTTRVFIVEPGEDVRPEFIEEVAPK